MKIRIIKNFTVKECNSHFTFLEGQEWDILPVDSRQIKVERIDDGLIFQVAIPDGMFQFIGEEKAEDFVNHPKHYTFGKIEVITVIEDWKLGFCLGNAIKYIARADHKGTAILDLEKAAWYLNREIERRKSKLGNQ